MEYFVYGIDTIIRKIGMWLNTGDAETKV